MRPPLALMLLAVCSLTPIAQAGTLSRARGAVREAESHGEHKDDRQEEGSLSSARREVRREQRASHHRPKSRSHHHGAVASRGHLFFPFDPWGPCICPPVVQTYVVPPPACTCEVGEPQLAAALERQFARYPHADNIDGFTRYGSPGTGQQWLGQVQMELGSDLQGLDRRSAGVLLEHVGGLGVEFDWNSYTEELPHGGHDELHIGELNLLCAISESDHARLRLGLGTVWLGDRYDTDFGWNLTLRGDWAPADPWLLSGELDLGTLGDAEHLHAAGSIGVMIDRCELYGGYDYRQIGEAKIAGPMVGLRLWF